MKITRLFGGIFALGALAASAQAGAVGICVISYAYAGAASSGAEYASAIVTAGCNPVFFPRTVAGGTVTPMSLPAGLTTATITATQPLQFGGNAVATTTSSLDQAALHAYGNSQGTGAETDGQGYEEGLFADNIHFTITDSAPSAIVTVHAHLDGTIGLEAGSNANNYNILDEFTLGGNGCYESLTGIAGQPCATGNSGFITSSFTNQSASGFDFSGTFQVTNGTIDPVSEFLQMDCQGGAVCDFSNTASLSLSLPSDVTYTSDSGVLFTQTAGTPTPEPGTFGLIAAAFSMLVLLRGMGTWRAISRFCWIAGSRATLRQ